MARIRVTAAEGASIDQEYYLNIQLDTTSTLEKDAGSLLSAVTLWFLILSKMKLWQNLWMFVPYVALFFMLWISLDTFTQALLSSQLFIHCFYSLRAMSSPNSSHPGYASADSSFLLPRSSSFGVLRRDSWVLLFPLPFSRELILNSLANYFWISILTRRWIPTQHSFRQG